MYPNANSIQLISKFLAINSKEFIRTSEMKLYLLILLSVLSLAIAIPSPQFYQQPPGYSNYQIYSFASHPDDPSTDPIPGKNKLFIVTPNL